MPTKLEEFYDSPTGQNATHRLYAKSFFIMSPAPEYATGEVVISSLYRNVGYPSIGEKDVPSNGNGFYKFLQSDITDNRSMLNNETWKTIIDDILKSPKQPNQSKQRFIQLTPLVPTLTLYTSAARLKGNAWNPGELVKTLLGFSPCDKSEIDTIWKLIFNSLNVDENDDDIWARFIEKELSLLSTSTKLPQHCWKFKPYGDNNIIDTQDAKAIKTPAHLFFHDLNSILSLKTKLTRRQWISMLESLLRIGTASHVLWICHVHSAIWSLIKDSLQGKKFSRQDIILKLSMPEQGFWSYGEKSDAKIKDRIRDYYKSRIGINFILYVLDDARIELSDDSLHSVDGLMGVLTELSNPDNKEIFSEYNILEKHLNLTQKEPLQLDCKKGTTSNMKEFIRYSLGQRQTSDIELKSYDQGYFLRKNGSYPAAPWIVSFGPVAAMLLAHCCSKTSNYYMTINDFCKHINGYGFSINVNDVPNSELGSLLRNLGLVLDSPDAEGGMIILPPFNNSNNLGA